MVSAKSVCCSRILKVCCGDEKEIGMRMVSEANHAHFHIFDRGSAFCCVVIVDVCCLEYSLESAQSRFFGLPA